MRDPRQRKVYRTSTLPTIFAPFPSLVESCVASIFAIISAAFTIVPASFPAIQTISGAFHVAGGASRQHG